MKIYPTFPVKNLKGKICLSPFVSVQMDVGGDVRLCPCYHWQPQSVGNIFENTLEEILSGQLATNIRASILEGTFEYCNEKTCGIIQNNQLSNINDIKRDQILTNELDDPTKFRMPKEFWLDIDSVCNLSCPSCRPSVIKLSKNSTLQSIEFGQTISQQIFGRKSNEHIKIHLSTAGEVFASVKILGFISALTLNSFPNLEWHLQTNGILAPSRWFNLGEQRKNVKSVTVSVDGTTPDVYEKLRRGAKWIEIQHALRWLAEKKKENNMELRLRMIVQKDNFAQMEDFYHMAQSFSADLVEFSAISNWGTYSDDEFSDIDVFNSKHPMNSEALEMYNRVKGLNNVLFFGRFKE